jgi:hypothetical protein
MAGEYNSEELKIRLGAIMLMMLWDISKMLGEEMAIPREHTAMFRDMGKALGEHTEILSEIRDYLRSGSGSR